LQNARGPSGAIDNFHRIQDLDNDSNDTSYFPPEGPSNFRQATVRTRFQPPAERTNSSSVAIQQWDTITIPREERPRSRDVGLDDRTDRTPAQPATCESCEKIQTVTKYGGMGMCATAAVVILTANPILGGALAVGALGLAMAMGSGIR
jgi:hypothetical protein